MPSHKTHCAISKKRTGFAFADLHNDVLNYEYVEEWEDYNDEGFIKGLIKKFF